MKNSLTFEKITLDTKGAVYLDNGMMKVPATLTRVGVFDYMGVDGKRRRELRTEDEVFAPDSMASFENVPLTNDHPYAEGGAVTAENARKLTMGTISNVHRAGKCLDGMVTIYDADTIKDVKNGKTQLSCGYFKALEERAGIQLDESGNRQPYTHVQHNIRGNHVALVQVGRAGPDARLRLDSANDVTVLVTDEIVQPAKETRTMEKITLDSMIAEMPEASASIVKKAIGDRDAKLVAQASSIAGLESQVKDAKSANDKLQATCDSAQNALKEAQDPAKFNAAVTARVGLESNARKILGEATDLSKMNARQVKVAVIGKLAPALACDGKSDDYVDAAYEIHTADASKGNAASQVVTKQLESGQAVVVKTSVSTDAAQEKTPFQKMMEDVGTSKPWKPNA